MNWDTNTRLSEVICISRTFSSNEEHYWPCESGDCEVDYILGLIRDEGGINTKCNSCSSRKYWFLLASAPIPSVIRDTSLRYIDHPYEQVAQADWSWRQEAKLWCFETSHSERRRQGR